MATDLKDIEAMVLGNTGSVKPASVSVTVFSGGKDRGRCIQLGVVGKKGDYSFQGEHAHLDISMITELRDQLNAVIEGDYRHLEE